MNIKKNIIYQMTYRIIMPLLSFILSPYIARVVGAEGIGIYSYSYNIAYFFVLFSMLGLDIYGCRLMAQHRDDPEKISENFSSVMILHILNSLLCLVIYLGYVFFLNSNKIYAAIQGIYVLSAVFNISWFYFGIEKFKITVTRDIIIKILLLICIFAFVKDYADLWIYCIIMAVSNLLSQLVLWLPLHKYVHFVLQNWKDVKKHIIPLVKLFLPMIAVSIYRQVDKVMLGTISAKTELGYYENADKVISISFSLISGYGVVMLPRISYLFSKGEDKMKANYYMRISMRYVMCLAIAIFFGIAAISERFSVVFWGEEFRKSGTLMIGLAVTIPFLAFADIIRTQFLIPAGKDYIFIISVISGGIVNFIINAILIPLYGAIGAVIGTIAAEVTVCLIQSIGSRNDIEIVLFLKNCVPFCAFGMAMFGVEYMINRILSLAPVMLAVQIGVGIVVYSLLCIIYFLWIKDDYFLGYMKQFKIYISKHRL